MADGNVNAWPRVALGEVLRRRALDVDVMPGETYAFAGVQSFGRGVFRSVVKRGSEFSYPKLTRVCAGDVTFPKLMAWEGAIGVVPQVCDGLVVSPEFPVFEVDRQRAMPDFLDLVLRRESFWPHLSGGSTGTNVRRRRLHPDEFTGIVVSLPPLAEQQRIVARVADLCAKVDEARRLRASVATDTVSLAIAAAHRADLSADEKRERGWSLLALGEFLRAAREEESVSPTKTYPNVGMYSFGRGLFRKPAISGSATSASSLFKIRSGQFIYSRLFAFEGAFGVVADEHDGSFVSNEYPTFSIDPERALPGFLRAYFLSPTVWSSLAIGAVGLGDRRQRVQPDVLLRHQVWLPPLDYQRAVEHAEQAMTRSQAIQDEQTVELELLRSAIIERGVRGEL